MNHLNDIENRDAKRDIAAELLSAVGEMLANTPVKIHTITQTDVALARQNQSSVSVNLLREKE